MLLPCERIWCKEYTHSKYEHLYWSRHTVRQKDIQNNMLQSFSAGGIKKIVHVTHALTISDTMCVGFPFRLGALLVPPVFYAVFACWSKTYFFSCAVHYTVTDGNRADFIYILLLHTVRCARFIASCILWIFFKLYLTHQVVY